MRKPEAHLIIIFGASGDLTFRKLIPALHKLFKKDLMPEKFIILGIGRSRLNDSQFRDKMKSSIEKFTQDKSVENSFISKLYYFQMEYDYADSYITLKNKVEQFQKEFELNENILHYLATPPKLYGLISDNLAKSGLNKKGSRIIIEKPFGVDLESAKKLNQHLLSDFSEDQIYRIDHYLGKETVQNILVTRFSNTIFEPIWNRNYIHHVEITSSESLGVENRGGYYDHSGALRDMVQNHLLQLVGLVAMEPPVNSDSESIRNEMVKVFQSFRPLTKEDIRKNVIRGQYLESTVRGEKVNSYRDEEGVAKESKTETYAALKFYIDNWRWNDVPFYVRTGKRLPTRVTEIVIHFQETPHHIFCQSDGIPVDSNQLIIRIQPDEGILLKFGMKVPGAGFSVQKVNMDFHYSSLSEITLPDAYQRLLLDCMLKDSTLYSRADAVENTWKFINPVLEAWENDPSIPLYGYPSGSWGPEIAAELIEEPELTWRYPCKNLADDGIYCEL
ncbi:MAG: glucose-6-phosphate dehydrogenase [Bacteroidales bacterium]